MRLNFLTTIHFIKRHIFQTLKEAFVILPIALYCSIPSRFPQFFSLRRPNVQTGKSSVGLCSRTWNGQIKQPL